MTTKEKGSLNRKQKAFIKAKVLSLGSVERVNLFYRQKDLVSEFARSIAAGKIRKGANYNGK